MKRTNTPVAVLILALSGVMSAAYGAGLPGEKHPAENLTVSGQPTLEHLESLKEQGYSTIINLRRDGEFDDFDEPAEVARLGMTYVHIPIRNVKSITEEDAGRLHEAISTATGPVLLHCTVGWRAGSLWAIEQYLLHDATEAEALDLAASAHMDHAVGDVEDWIDEHGTR
jgi:uncharacterized protein (TIGR01244 family)